MAFGFVGSCPFCVVASDPRAAQISNDPQLGRASHAFSTFDRDMMFTTVVFGVLLQGLVVLASYPVQSLRNARCNGILPTPTYGLTGSLFTVCAEELIAAPVSRIYDTLIDFRNYHIWNSFVIDVKVPATVINPSDVSVGMSMDFTTQGLLPLLNSTSTEIVTVLSPGTDFAVNAWEAMISSMACSWQLSIQMC